MVLRQLSFAYYGRMIATMLYPVTGQDGISSCQPDSLSLTQIGHDLVGGNYDDGFGIYISLSNSGNVLAVGAPRNNVNGIDSGSVTVFQRNNANLWVQKGSSIYGEAAGDITYFNTLSADGSIIAVSSRLNDDGGTNAGKVRVYQFDNNNWQQMGSDIYGFEMDAQFGYGLDISDDGTILAVGSYLYGANDEGQVRVFQYSNRTHDWEQRGTSISGDNDFASLNNIALSQDGNIIAGADKGRVHIYRFINDDWEQMGPDILGNADDRFGFSVVLSNEGNIVTIAASPPYGDNKQGYVSSYIFFDNAWVQRGNLLVSGAFDDEFGNSISQSGDGKILIVGAPFYNANGSNSGHVQVFYFQNDKWLQVFENIQGQQANQEFGDAVAVSSDGSTIAIGGDSSSNVNGIVKVFQVQCAPSSLEGVFVSKTFQNVFIEFLGVRQMSVSDMRRFEAITEYWYSQYFASQSIDLDVQQMVVNIAVTNQEWTDSKNKVIYDQTLTYKTYDEKVDPEPYIYLPFLDRTSNKEYGSRLSEELGPFMDLIVPVAIPQVTTQNFTDNATSSNPDSTVNKALIGGIMGAAVFTLLIAFVGMKFLKKNRTNSNDQSTEPIKNPTVHVAGRNQIQERSDSLPLTSPEGQGPGFKDQARSATATSQPSQEQTTTGVLLQESLPSYKDQVCDNHIAVAEAVPLE